MSEATPEQAPQTEGKGFDALKALAPEAAEAPVVREPKIDA